MDNAKFSSELGAYRIVFTGEMSKLNLSYGDFINFHFRLENSENLPDSLTLDYDAFFDEDPSHMCLVAMEYNWKAGLINNEHIVALYLSEGEREGSFSIKETSLWKGFLLW
ncbi:hypothetical protein [Zobellia laminariae]|uniref:hypothetical protein n=1 Tax=Zobellia laminariae TaxID=248906 RepID=UPI0026F46AED|nr:hypothetical protein [Zobellia laminariae]WKX76443.1 hypothetical protein Q5W13_23375 [Zobellia laminariae]